MKTFDNVEKTYTGAWRHKMRPFGLFGRTEAPVLECEVLTKITNESGDLIETNDWVSVDEESHAAINPDDYLGFFDQEGKRIG